VSRVLVTGGTGFVGRHCLAPLVERGFETHAVSRAGPDDELVGGVPEVAWHVADLLAPGEASRLVDEVRPTHLLHLAWFAEPGSYWESPQNLAWLAASVTLLGEFADRGGRRIAVAGSGAEYAASDRPCAEDATPIEPASLYASSKHALHLAAAAYARTAGISLAWARLFFLYGPHERPERLVPSIARAVLAGESAAATDGTQVRDFLHVVDAGDALAALLDCPVEGAVNIASGDPVAVARVAELTATAAGRPDLLRLGELARPSGDPPTIAAAVARLGDEVGWRPRIGLEHGVERTVAWWRERTG